MRGGVLGARVPITGWMGAVEFGRFPLDLSTELHPVGVAEQHTPNPVVVIDDVAPLPPMTVYPLCDQVADKVCAMNAHYSGGAVSTRYRDLVDLVLIVTQCALDAALTASALAVESHRRTLVLPTALTAPAPSWGRRLPHCRPRRRPDHHRPHPGYRPAHRRHLPQPAARHQHHPRNVATHQTPLAHTLTARGEQPN